MKTIQCHIPDHDLIMSIVINSAFITYIWFKTDTLLSIFLFFPESFVWVTTYISQFCHILLFLVALIQSTTLHVQLSDINVLHYCKRHLTLKCVFLFKTKRMPCTEHPVCMREMRNAYKVKSINLNLNGRDLCMAGSIIFNCILKKEDRRMLTVSGLWTQWWLFMQKQKY